nr:proline-rich receptor-like protein kinase PERK2 [Arachis hypogaea]
MKPSTRSQDHTFTPSPSPPTSPPRTDCMTQTKNPSRSPSSFKPTAPSSAPSNPSTSKGKRPAAEEPVPEPTRPKPRSAPSRPQREESPPPSASSTSASIGHKTILYEVVKDVVQKFVSQSNHMIAMSKEQRKLATKHENFLRKPRDRVAVFLKFIDNLQEDDNAATDPEEDAGSEEDGLDA